MVLVQEQSNSCSCNWKWWTQVFIPNNYRGTGYADNDTALTQASVSPSGGNG